MKYINVYDIMNQMQVPSIVKISNTQLYDTSNEFVYKILNEERVELIEAPDKKYLVFNGKIRYNNQNIDVFRLWLQNSIKNSMIAIEVNNIPIIVSSCFENSPNLTNVIMRGTQGIGLYAFKNCPKLLHVEIPQVSIISEHVFDGCEKLETLITAPITQLGEYCFYGCSSLKQLPQFSNALTYIPKAAFYGCFALTELDFGNTNINTFYNYAFYNCTNVENIIFPNVNHWMGVQSFFRVGRDGNGFVLNLKTTQLQSYSIFEESGATSITFSGSGTDIQLGSDMFKNCKKLAGSITLHPQINQLNNNVFMGCDQLTYINTDNDSLFIGSGVFQGCTNLIEINKPIQYNQSVDTTSIFEGCSSLQQIRLVDNTTVIPNYAFKNCSSLTNVYNASQISIIGDRAFLGCTNLSGSIIQDNITSIGYGAFAKCNNLGSFTIRSTVNVGTFAFARCVNLGTITYEPETVTRGCFLEAQASSVHFTSPTIIFKFLSAMFKTLTSQLSVYIYGQIINWQTNSNNNGTSVQLQDDFVSNPKFLPYHAPSGPQNFSTLAPDVYLSPSDFGYINQLPQPLHIHTNIRNSSAYIISEVYFSYYGSRTTYIPQVNIYNELSTADIGKKIRFVALNPQYPQYYILRHNLDDSEDIYLGTDQEYQNKPELFKHTLEQVNDNGTKLWKISAGKTYEYMILYHAYGRSDHWYTSQAKFITQNNKLAENTRLSQICLDVRGMIVTLYNNDDNGKLWVRQWGGYETAVWVNPSINTLTTDDGRLQIAIEAVD